MADRCHGLAGLLFGHDFQPVYEFGAPTFQLETVKGDARGAVALLEASKPQRYLHSECSRCGILLHGRLLDGRPHDEFPEVA